MTFAEIRDAVNDAFRDYVVKGVPATGANEPVKQEVREALMKAVIAIEQGGFSEPPTWAADLAEVQSRLEQVDANVSESLALFGSLDAVQAASGQAVNALEEIRDLAANAPDAPSVANKVNRNGSNVEADAFRGAIGAAPENLKITPSAATKSVGAILREHYTLANYMEAADGASAMRLAAGRLFADAMRSSVQVDLGDNNFILDADYTIPVGRRAVFDGVGTVDFSGGSIVRGDHDSMTIINGIKAVGANPMFKFTGDPSISAFHEFEISRVEARMDPGVWAIYTDGAREGIVEKCYFKSGRGIYRTKSNILHVRNCFFLDLGFAVHSDGQGSPFSCGFNLDHSEILGCNRSLVVDRDDDGAIYECTIDYNDEGIYLLGQDRFKIFGGYIGTRKAQAATPNVALGAIGPGIAIKGSSGTRSEKIRIIGAILTGHDDDNLGYSNIYVEDADKLTISDSTLSFYTQNGLRYGSGVTYLNAHDNDYAPKSGGGAVNAIECAGADSNTNNFRGGSVSPGQGVVAPSASVSGIKQFLTERKVAAVIGTGTLSTVVTHGLAFTPTGASITVTPTNAKGWEHPPIVTSITATQFTISTAAAPTANAGYVWEARRLPL